MDQRLILALENLGNALEEIASSLQSKDKPKTSGVEALKAGDFGKQLESINKQLTSIKADTQAILREQKTIQSMSKQKDPKKQTPMEEIGKDKKKESSLKKGLGTILLIAVAVLAIGMAFKLVGKIDFLSVVALGLAIYVVAQAFAKIAALNLSLREAFITSLVMVLMSVAITLSSYVLRMIAPVGIRQLITAVAIAGVFAIIGMSLKKLGKGFSAFDKLLGAKAAYVVPLVMVALSIAITYSSHIMSLITPIGFLQALTAIAISVVFAIIGISIEKIAKGIDLIDKKLGARKAAMLFPLILVAIATAITISSYVLSQIQPIGLMQFLTALGIAILFAIMSFVFKPMAEGIKMIDKKLGAAKAAMLFPLILVAIATAITLSSFVLAQVQPISLMQFLTALGIAILFGIMSLVFEPLGRGIKIIDKALGKKGLLMIPIVFVALALAIMLSSHILSVSAEMSLGQILSIAVFGVGLGLVILAMLPSVLLVGLASVSGVGAGAIALGVLMVPLIALAVMLSSHILAAGKYNKYPGVGWILSVGVIMTGFSIAVLALGMIAVTGVGLVAILAGVLLVPLIAVSIVATDKIIGKGKYNKYPGLGWILSVGVVMTGFGIAVLALGIIAVTGVGLVAILAGVLLVPLIAKSIVATDKIIGKGKYNKYPGLEWALSVGGLMTVFGLAVLVLGSFIVGSLGFGYIALKAGQKAVQIIAQSIVDVARIFNKNSSVFKFGPKKEWAEGVAIALGAFAPVYKMLMRGGIMSIFTGTGPSPGNFANAIRTISQGIVDAAVFFNSPEAQAGFTTGPKKEWSEGVGKAIGAFAPVYKMLDDFPYSGGDKMKRAIIIISKGIIASAGIFSQFNARFSSYPSVQWAAGVGGALKAFAPVYKILKDFPFTAGDKMKRAITIISKGIVDTAKIFAEQTDWKIYPGPLWNYNVKMAIQNYIDMSKKFSKFRGGDDTLPDTATRLVKVAKILYFGKKFFTLDIDPNYMKKVGKNILDFNHIVMMLAKSERGSLMGSIGKGINSLFGNDPISKIANRMVILAGAYDKLATSLIKLGVAMRMLNIRDARMLGGITTSIVNYRVKDNKDGSQSRPEAGPRLEGTRFRERNAPAMGGIKDGVDKDEKMFKKMDEILKVLKSIDRSVSSVDDYILEKANISSSDKIF